MNVFKTAVAGYTDNWNTLVSVLDDFSDVLRVVGLGSSTVGRFREDGSELYVIQLHREQSTETIDTIAITEEEATDRERLEALLLAYMKSHQELFSYDWEAEDA